MYYAKYWRFGRGNEHGVRIFGYATRAERDRDCDEFRPSNNCPTQDLVPIASKHGDVRDAISHDEVDVR